MAMRRLRAKAAAADALVHAPEQVGCQLEALETVTHSGYHARTTLQPELSADGAIVGLLHPQLLEEQETPRCSRHRACVATGVPRLQSPPSYPDSLHSHFLPLAQGYSALVLSETEPVPSTSELFQSIGISVEKSKVQAQSPMSKQALRQHLARANSRRPGHKQSRPDSAIASSADQSTLPTPRRQPAAAVQQDDAEGSIKAVNRSMPISS